MIQRIIMLLLIGLAGFAYAEDCTTWSDTTDLPIAYPDIEIEDIEVLGSLLVGVKDQTFSAFQLDGQSEPTLLASLALSDCVRRMRLLDGQIYLVMWQGVVQRVDIMDPEVPQLIAVNLPPGAVTDLAEFDSGILVVTSSDLVYVVDDLEATVPSVLAELAVDSPREVVAHGNIAYVELERGLLPIDLTDPGQPVVGDIYDFCPDDQSVAEIGAENLAIRDGMLYGQFTYIRYPQYYGQYAMAVDIDSPLEPVPVSWYPISGIGGGLEFLGDYVVMLSNAAVEVFGTGDLRPVASIYFESYSSTSTAIQGDDLLITTPHRGLHRLDFLDPHAIGPEFLLPDGYDAVGCGQYGITTQYTYWHDIEGNSYMKEVDWAVYDQTIPLDLEPLDGGHVDVHSTPDNPCGFSMGLEDSDDRRVVLRVRSSCLDNPNNELWIRDLEHGTHDAVELWDGGNGVLDGQTLWTLRYCYWGYPMQLATYGLSADGVNPLGVLDVSYGLRVHVDEQAFLVCRDSVQVFDASQPSNLAPIDVLHLDQNITLRSVGFVEGGLLYTTTSTGMAVIDLAPAGDDAPVVLGACDLEIGDFVMGLERQGQRVILHKHDGWQAVDLSDPTSPQAISPLVSTYLKGLHWSGHLLYLNTVNALYLYDVTDLANPVWIGQSGYNWTLTKPCMLDRYLISGEWVLLPDCEDMTANEPHPPDEPAKIPPVTSLAPVVPNPFNPSTTITFALERAEHVELIVHDLRGRRVAKLLDRMCQPGQHCLQWNGRDDRGRALPSGTYLVQLRTEMAIRSAKAVLVR